MKMEYLFANFPERKPAALNGIMEHRRKERSKETGINDIAAQVIAGPNKPVDKPIQGPNRMPAITGNTISRENVPPGINGLGIN
jgi:hypothetical protein